MSKILTYFLVIITITFQINARDIDYDFNRKSDHIKVGFSIEGDQNGETSLRWPLFLTNNLFSGLHNIEIYIGGKLFRKIASLNMNQGGNSILKESDYISFKHKPGEKIYIKYDLYNSKEPNNLFILTKDKFFLTNKSVLIIPEISESEINNVKFSWVSDNKFILSNLGKMIENKLSTNINIHRLEEGFFFSGEKTDTYNSVDDSKMIFFAENMAKEKKKEIVKFIRFTEKTHNDFFGNITNINGYFVILNSDAGSTVGERIDNVSIIMTNDKNKSYFKDLKNYIAHEHIHKWFYGIIKSDKNLDQFLTSWFFEGFTVYYTDYLNYLNRTISAKEYIDNYNKSLERYFTSPYRKFRDENLTHVNYFDPLYDFTYIQGRIFAQELDSYIKNVTNNNYSLNHYIKSLVNRSILDKSLIVTNEFFVNDLSEKIGHDISKIFKEHIIDKNFTVRTKYLLNGKAKLENIDAKDKSYDLDIVRSLLNYEIIGLKENSINYKKGLRNKQFIERFLYNLDNDGFFEIFVGGKKFPLSPNYSEITIPNYILN